MFEYRLCLLLFWSLCSLASLLFVCIVVHKKTRIGTSHRKFFHLTASLVTVTGLFYDPPLLALSVHLMLQLFIIFEVLRSRRVQPFCLLDRWLLLFIDGRQESPEQITTPILLLAGLNMPILLDFRLLYAALYGGSSSSSGGIMRWTIKQWHFAGVISVGVGDSAAALIGSKFGRIQWHSLLGNGPNKSGKNGKTLEGSLAMFVTQIVASELIMMLNAGGRFSSSPTRPWQNDDEDSSSSFSLLSCCSVSNIVPSVIAALVATLMEAHLNRFDNILVPLASMLILWLFG